MSTHEAATSGADQDDTGAPGDAWDRRFAEQSWPTDPDPYLVGMAGSLPPGRGLDLGAGPGRNSLWLALKGWQMMLVDASGVGLAQATAAAEALGISVTTVRADLNDWRPEEEAFDLVIVANLHPGPGALAALLAGAAGAMRTGGHLYVVGHHIDNLGRHGPPNPDRLLTPERLRASLPRGLLVEVLETRERRADHGRDDDAARRDKVVLAWATKPGSLRGPR